MNLKKLGVNKALGYRHPGDELFPKFYWTGVYPYIQGAPAIPGVDATGQDLLPTPYSNVVCH